MEGTIDPGYKREFPRDFFNEGKLFNCLGRLSLYELDYGVAGLEVLVDETPLRAGLHSAGYLVLAGGAVFLVGGQRLVLGTTYNTRAENPLLLLHENEEIQVFSEDGSLTREFRDFCRAGPRHYIP